VVRGTDGNALVEWPTVRQRLARTSRCRGTAEGYPCYDDHHKLVNFLSVPPQSGSGARRGCWLLNYHFGICVRDRIAALTASTAHRWFKSRIRTHANNLAAMGDGNPVTFPCCRYGERSSTNVSLFLLGTKAHQSAIAKYGDAGMSAPEFHGCVRG
jgi:hypothetical protein